jgi:hypothetical protein
MVPPKNSVSLSQEPIIEERNREMRQIESDLNDLNYIFQELGALLPEQGERLALSERRIEVARNQTESGVEDLQAASQIKNKTRRLQKYVGLGTGAGAVAGAAGFIFLPPLAAAGLLAVGTGLGFGSGAALGYFTKT